MKAYVVKAVPCETVRSLSPDTYLGYRLAECSSNRSRIEHLLLARGRIVRARRRCNECVLGSLSRTGHLLAAPVLTSTGHLKFIVTATPSVRRELAKYHDQVVEVKEVNLKKLALTPKQRKALSLLARENNSLSKLAQVLGVSKTAAHKLVRKSLQKIAEIHT